MTTTDERLRQLQAHRGALELERLAAGKAEADRLEREQAHARKIVDTDRQIAALERERLAAEVDASVERAAQARADNLAAVARMVDEAAPLVDAICAWHNALALPATEAFSHAVTAVDYAAGAAYDAYNASPAPAPSAGSIWPEQDNRASLLGALGQTWQRMEAPMPPYAALAELAGRQGDELRRRAVWGLLVALTGQFVAAAPGYNAQEVAARDEQDRRKSKRLRLVGGF